MDFISKLRMNNLYNPETGNQGLGPPSGMNSDPMELFQRFYPYIAQEKERDFAHQKELMSMEHPQPSNPHLGNIASSMQPPPQQGPMNVVFKDDSPTPYQKGELSLKDKQLAEKTTNDKGQLSEKTINDTGKLKQGEEKIQQTGKLGEEKIQNTKSKNVADEENKAKRTLIYKFKAEHPNMEIKAEKGGNFFAFDRITGKGMDTGVNSGSLSDEDRLAITGEQKINEINTRGYENRTTQEMKGNQNLDAIAARGTENRNTNAAKPVRDQLPTQTRRQQLNTARQLQNSDPELAPFISFDPNTGEVIIAKPGSRRGPTQAQFDKINSTIYGKSKTKNDELPDPAGIR